MTHAHLIGGGIASLSAAVYLIRDAGMPGEHVHIYEYLGLPGGSLDGSGSAADGFMIRGGRMFEEHFGCTFDLLDGIPTLGGAGQSVAAEIKQFTADVRPSSRCRLVVDGQRCEAPAFQLKLGDKLKLLLLSQQPESALQGKTIEQYFGAHFFSTNFWAMWCTMFAFQPWHSVVEMRRYMRRFMHLLPGFNRLEGIYRTRLNQYDSIVRPVVHWLEEQGVNIHLNCTVNDLSFDTSLGTVTGIHFEPGTACSDITTSSDDLVFITLGSMTEDSSLGSMSTPPQERSQTAPHCGAWPLWRRIAARSKHFGRPDVFAGNVEQTRWLSFTVTLDNARFFEFMENFTGNSPGTGGLVTFKHSGWLTSVVLAHQPHFSGQPEGTYVFWGYGLRPERNGDHINKPMLQCSGTEILAELAYQLELGAAAREMFASANCIPCLMPHITTQFMPRSKGDRPSVIPAESRNFAFIGQYVELPDDTVFTVEYSVRSAQTAVYNLCATQKRPTPLFRGYLRPSIVGRALSCILNNGPPPRI